MTHADLCQRLHQLAHSTACVASLATSLLALSCTPTVETAPESEGIHECTSLADTTWERQ